MQANDIKIPVAYTYQQVGQPQQIKPSPARYVIISIFWSAFVLNCIGGYLGNNDDTIHLGSFIETIASLMYFTNVIFLIMGRVPNYGPIQGRGCDCQCSCMSRPYAVASAVFFAFSIAAVVLPYIYLG